MMRVLLGLLLGCAVSAGAAAQALPSASTVGTPAPAVSFGPPANPYSVSVPVAGTSDAQRDAAIGNALAQVLQQVAPGVTASPEQLSQASSYVRDFHYQRAPSGVGLALQVDFDSGAVHRLLAGLAATPAPATNAAVPGAPAPPVPGTPAATSGNGKIWVAGIDNSHAFATLLSTLRGDDALHDVRPVSASGDGVLLSVRFDQPLASVLAGLTGPGGHMVPAALPHLGADASLQWVP